MQLGERLGRSSSAHVVAVGRRRRGGSGWRHATQLACSCSMQVEDVTDRVDAAQPGCVEVELAVDLVFDPQRQLGEVERAEADLAQLGASSSPAAPCRASPAPSAIIAHLVTVDRSGSEACRSVGGGAVLGQSNRGSPVPTHWPRGCSPVQCRRATRCCGRCYRRATATRLSVAGATTRRSAPCQPDPHEITGRARRAGFAAVASDPRRRCSSTNTTACPAGVVTFTGDRPDAAKSRSGASISTTTASTRAAKRCPAWIEIQREAVDYAFDELDLDELTGEVLERQHRRPPDEHGRFTEAGPHVIDVPTESYRSDWPRRPCACRAPDRA